MKRKNIFLITGSAVVAVVFAAVLSGLAVRDRINVGKVNLWSIGIYAGSSPYQFKDPPEVRNPVLTPRDVHDVPAEFLADPFMMRRDSVWYMFFEVLNQLTKQGDIGLAQSRDGFRWEYRKIVLDEPFHLSYPFVFDWEGATYMIPESHEANELRLYRATNFPVMWEKVAVLLEGRFADHAIFRRDETWWLLVGADPVAHSVLRLFYADTLSGPWTEHAASPVIANNGNSARPGGRALAYHDRVIRYAQECDPTYGKALNAFDILELTRESFAERKAAVNPVLQPGRKGWNLHGMHQLDAHEMTNGTWIACVDGYRKRIFVSFDY